MEENKIAELVIVCNDLGASTVNTFCEEMLNKLENIKNKYQDINALIDPIGELKKDKALINKVSKSINDYRIAKEKEFMQPFNEKIKEPINGLVKKMNGVSDELKSIISDLETKDEQIVEEDINVAQIPNNEELKVKYVLEFPDNETKKKIMAYMEKYKVVIKEIK